MTLTVVAHIHAKPGQEELVKSSLSELVTHTVKEEGCLKYVLHVDSKDPAHFVMIESWVSEDALKAHMKMPHMAANYARIKDAITSTAIHQVNPV